MFTLLINISSDLLVLNSMAARHHHRLLVQAMVNAQNAWMCWGGGMIWERPLSQGATGTWPTLTLVV